MGLIHIPYMMDGNIFSTLALKCALIVFPAWAVSWQMQMNVLQSIAAEETSQSEQCMLTVTNLDYSVYLQLLI